MKSVHCYTICKRLTLKHSYTNLQIIQLSEVCEKPQMTPHIENKIERLLSKESPWNIFCRSLFRSFCVDCWYHAMIEKEKLEFMKRRDLVLGALDRKVNTSAEISASLIFQCNQSPTPNALTCMGQERNGMRKNTRVQRLY